MGYKGARLTVGDRILMLLINYTRFRGEMQAPIDMTQDGIASNLGIIRSAVPRAVGSLMNKGLVEEGLAHISGLSRRRKVYMLTDEGIMSSRELTDSLSVVKVDVIGEEGSEKRSIGDLIEENMVDLKNISDVLTRGKLDLTMKKVEKAEKKLEKTSYIHSLNPPKIFLGREREIKEIQMALKSNRRKITVVYGIAGVGKTTLAWKITEMLSMKMNIFYIDLKEWTSVGYVLKELANFLSRSGWNGLKDYIDTNKEPDIEMVADLIKTLPEGIPILLILDDLQRAPREISMALFSLKERLQHIKDLDMIVLSRERATFYDIRDVKISGLIGEIELLGFDRETSRKLLMERGFNRDEVDNIIDKTGGHPLALALVEKEGYDLDIEDFNQFLKEEIFNGISKEESKMLGLLSLSRLQLGDNDLRSFMDIDRETMTNLMNRHLIFMTPGGYVIHDLIRTQAVTSLSPEEKEECHRLLAGLFKEKLSNLGFHQEIGGIVPPYPFGIEDDGNLGPVPLYVTEEIFHLIGAGEHEKALPVMVEAMVQIPSKDIMKEHKESLFEGLPPNPGSLLKAQMDLIESTWRLMDDDPDGSLSLVESLSGLDPGDDEILSTIVQCARLWKPFLVDRVKGPEDAINELENLETEMIPEDLLDYFLVMEASLRYKTGDYKGASRDYRKFLDSIIANEDLPEKLKESVMEAVDRAEKGSIQVATDNFQRIMEITGSNKDILREILPYVDVDHHLLSAIYSLYHGNK